MALKDALKTPPQPRPGNPSKIDAWRDSLTETDRAAFDAAVKNPAWNHSALTRVVNDEGLDIGVKALTEWRAKQLRSAA